MATPKNLVESWLAAESAAGKTKTQAKDDLNRATGMHYTLARVCNWEAGDRDVPVKARQYMLRIALPHLLAELDEDPRAMTAAAVRKLADRLS